MTADFNVILNFNSAKPVITGAEFKAGDKGFTINMDVRELDPTGMTPKIAFYRTNGTSVESSAVTNVGNIFSYTLLGNELAVPGIVVADLKFYDGDDQRISSASFIFTAIADTLDGLGGGTESYSDELEQLSAEFQDTLDDYIDAFGNTAPINPRGDYDNTATYEPRDMVYDTNTGTSWVCKQESTGNAPTNGSAYWQKLVSSTGSLNLDDLADVDAASPSDGDLLGYDSNSGDWKPMAAPATGVTSFNTRTGAVTPAAHDYDASDIDYTNTTSGLAATTAQGAIDESVANIKAVENVYGSKNLASNKTLDIFGNSYSLVGVTFTVDSTDSNIITCNNGPATQSAIYDVCSGATPSRALSLKKGTYILTGCPSGGGSNKYRLWIRDSANNDIAKDNGDGATFTLAADKNDLYLSIVIFSGYTPSNLTFKIMIRDARITDSTYAPYAQTNRQLTLSKAPSDSIAPTENGATASQAYAVGAYFYRGGDLCRCTSAISSGGTFTLNTNYTTVTIGTEIRGKEIVRTREVSYAQGVSGYGSEKVMCTEFSDGSILVNGLMTISANYTTTATNYPLFTLPDGVTFPASPTQKWAVFNEAVTGSGRLVVLFGAAGKYANAWSSDKQLSDIVGRSYIVDISW